MITLTLTAALFFAESVITARAAQPDSQPSESATAEVPQQPASDGRTLKVISYNVQFLPGPAAIANKRKDPPYRGRTIGTLLGKFDIVGLNEAFEKRPRDLLLGQLQAAWGDHYQQVIIPRPDDGRFMGGLAIAARSRFLATDHVLYSQGSSPEKYGFAADGFAAKGVLWARVWRGGDTPKSQFVDVFITHLESKDNDIRVVQYRELADFVRKHADPDHPTIVMGDMNTRGNPSYQERSDSPYHLMMKTYNDARPERPFVDLWPALHPGELGGTNEQKSSDIGNRIDYILLSNPPAPHSRLEAKSVRVNGYLDPKVVALSDHSAVEADLEWVDGQ